MLCAALLTDLLRAASALQELAALKQKAGEKGTFGGKGLSYSGKK